MVNRILPSNIKLKNHLEGTGHLIYLICDHDAQCVWQQAEEKGFFDLNSSNSDPTREKLAKSVLDLIAKDKASEKVRTELDWLEKIFSRQRKHGDSLANFVFQFNECVARFTIRSPA